MIVNNTVKKTLRELHIKISVLNILEDHIMFGAVLDSQTQGHTYYYPETLPFLHFFIAIILLEPFVNKRTDWPIRRLANPWKFEKNGGK